MPWTTLKHLDFWVIYFCSSYALLSNFFLTVFSWLLILRSIELSNSLNMLLNEDLILRSIVRWRINFKTSIQTVAVNLWKHDGWVSFSKNSVSCTASEVDAESEGPGKKPRQGITSDIIKELTDCNARLSGQRKKRQVRCWQLSI